MENSGKQSVHSSFMALFTRMYGLCWVLGEMHLCSITGSKVEGLVLLHKIIPLVLEPSAFNAWKLGRVFYIEIPFEKTFEL